MLCRKPFLFDPLYRISTSQVTESEQLGFIKPRHVLLCSRLVSIIKNVNVCDYYQQPSFNSVGSKLDRIHTTLTVISCSGVATYRALGHMTPRVLENNCSN